MSRDFSDCLRFDNKLFHAFVSNGRRRGAGRVDLLVLGDLLLTVSISVNTAV